MATIRKKDSEYKEDPPLPPVQPVTPPVTTAPPGSPFVPRAPTAPGQFTFVPPTYQPFQQATGYGYDDLLAQLRDAFDTPTRGAGNVGKFGGNNLPRYAFGNRPGGMPPPSGFNAGSFLAPYLAKMGGGTSGSPAPGTGAGPGMPAPGSPAPPLQPGIPQIPGAPPQGTPLPGGGMGAGGLLAPGYGQPIGNPTGMRTAQEPGSVIGQGGIRGLLNTGTQSPMAAFLAQLLAQQNMSGPGGARGGR